jgi:hypothetical protein
MKVAYEVHIYASLYVNDLLYNLSDEMKVVCVLLYV